MTQPPPTDLPVALREQNRASWNAVVAAHESHRPGLAAFLRRGGLTLFPEERELLGELADQPLLHLLCNSGADTLSMAALGAHAVGVDISDEAIEAAQRLSAASGLRATFVRADVYTYLAAVEAARFRRIYCGYGAICWLHDLTTFAAGVAAALDRGGRFVLMEFHPSSNMFDTEWRLTHAYPTGGASLTLDGVGDYVGSAAGGLSPGGHDPGMVDFSNPEPCHLFRWGIGEVISALAGAGLHLRTFREYTYVNGERPFARMRPAPGRRWLPPANIPAIPLMYGLMVEKV